MSRKCIYLMALVFVTGAGLGAPLCRGSLVSWWRLDALDANGKFPDAAGSNPGTPSGSTTVDTVVKQIGAGSAHFTGDGDIDVGQGNLMFIGKTAMTITAWINPQKTTGTQCIFSRATGNNACYSFRMEGTKLRAGVYTNGGWFLSAADGADMPTGTWTHVVMVYDGSSVTRYVNGKVHGAVMTTSGTALAQQGTAQVAAIGNRAAGKDQKFTGNIDDVRVYDHALTADEVQIVMTGSGAQYPYARQPTPPDGGLNASRRVQLAWKAGELAVTHKLYFGSDPNAVAAGAESTLRGEMKETTFAVADLQPGTTYYWRVDEINKSEPNSPWVGAVWSFFVPPLSAYGPSPTKAMQYVSRSPTLSWKAGLGSLLHYVSFGTDAAALGAASAQVETTYVPAGPLESGKTYYWRVDEYDPTTNVTMAGAVWSFTVVPLLPPAQDTTLLGWWKMDEVNAGLIVDSSGHALHGAITGTPHWIEGAAGAAVKLDGAVDCFTTPAPVDVNTNTVTMTAWINPDRVHTSVSGILFSRGTGTAVGAMNLKANNQLAYHWNQNASTYGFNSNLIVPMNEWSFVAVVVDPDRATLYLDGSQIMARNALANPPMVFNTSLCLGADPLGGRLFGGALDDVRFYTRALTEDEVDEVMAAGAKPVPVESTAMIESFDAYNAYTAQAGPDIWDVWSDGFGGKGTGSTAGYPFEPFMERNVVYGNHGQSLALGYNNTGSFLSMDGKLVAATLSEASRTFGPALDLTKGGATKLVLQVRGLATNVIEPTDNAYLTLTDGVKTDEILLRTAADLTKTGWTEVSIKLSTLTVNPAKVTKITLGVGNRTAPQIGGSGTIYIDEITRQ